MDPGTLELQIFVSLIVVLATAFVALVCDYLKGSNESLRERNIELRIRQEERELQRTIAEWNSAVQRFPIRTPVIRTPIKPAEPQPAPVPAVEESVPPSSVAPEPFAWTQPEAVKPEPEPASAPAPKQEERVAIANPLPSGMHDHSVLAKRMATPEAFSGVVVSIGINDYATQVEQAGPEAMAALMVSVESMITGLLRAGVDFGCRSGDDEFLLIYPNEKGAEAQRRLAAISERLWNFQLRASSNTAVLFCWGAVEVQGESLADSVASASERMHQTKRNRKMIALQAKPRKMAV
ncbi:MAG: hypothetical protein U0R19_04460 [Bryobacteraceae bacterium]